MEIKPIYVTFEQAKLFKEKGLNQNINSAWFNRVGNFLGICNIKEDGTEVTYFNTYSKAELVTKEYYDECCSYKYCAAEQWQVCEWLRVNHGIYIVPFPELLNGEQIRYYPTIFEQGVGEDIEQYFYTPQEAYSAAFDYVLKELI